MPIYEYACSRCAEVIEVLQGFSEKDLKTHEGCGGALKRLLSVPSLRVGGNKGLPGSTHSSILRFHDNAAIAASKKKAGKKRQ